MQLMNHSEVGSSSCRLFVFRPVSSPMRLLTRIFEGRKRAEMRAVEEFQHPERNDAVKAIMGRRIWLDDLEDGTSMHAGGLYDRGL